MNIYMNDGKYQCGKKREPNHIWGIVYCTG